MNTTQNHTETHPDPSPEHRGHRGPFGRRMHPFGPAIRDRMRAAFEDAGVSRRQWHLLSALESAPSTIAELEEARQRRRDERCAPKADAEPTAPDDARDASGATDDASEDGHRGARIGRFGRRGFGPGFGPFGRGFGPGFGPRHGGPGGHRGADRPIADLLSGLESRGLVQRDGDRWSLTATGATEVTRIRESVAAARASLRDGISDDDWDTAMSVLQRVAENTRR